MQLQSPAALVLVLVALGGAWKAWRRSRPRGAAGGGGSNGATRADNTAAPGPAAEAPHTPHTSAALPSVATPPPATLPELGPNDFADNCIFLARAYANKKPAVADFKQWGEKFFHALSGYGWDEQLNTTSFTNTAGASISVSKNVVDALVAAASGLGVVNTVLEAFTHIQTVSEASGYKVLAYYSKKDSHDFYYHYYFEDENSKKAPLRLLAVVLVQKMGANRGAKAAEIDAGKNNEKSLVLAKLLKLNRTLYTKDMINDVTGWTRERNTAVLNEMYAPDESQHRATTNTRRRLR